MKGTLSFSIIFLILIIEEIVCYPANHPVKGPIRNVQQKEEAPVKGMRLPQQKLKPTQQEIPKPPEETVKPPEAPANKPQEASSSLPDLSRPPPPHPEVPKPVEELPSPSPSLPPSSEAPKPAEELKPAQEIPAAAPEEPKPQLQETLKPEGAESTNHQQEQVQNMDVASAIAQELLKPVEQKKKEENNVPDVPAVEKTQEKLLTSALSSDSIETIRPEQLSGPIIREGYPTSFVGPEGKLFNLPLSAADNEYLSVYGRSNHPKPSLAYIDNVPKGSKKINLVYVYMHIGNFLTYIGQPDVPVGHS